MSDMSEMFPKRGAHDPALLDLQNLDRYERAHIPAGPPPKQDPHKRVFNFNEVFMGYDEEQAVVEAEPAAGEDFVADRVERGHGGLKLVGRATNLSRI